MKDHFAYLRYVLRHKWFVFKACLRLGVSLRLAILHDWTKFTPAEWKPYVHSFFNPDGTKRDIRKPDGSYDPTRVKAEFLKAWQHHERYNKHHWGYWLTFSTDSQRYQVVAHGDGYPIALYDYAENSRFVDEVPDDTTAFVGGKNVIYNLMVQVRDRLNRESMIIALEMPEVYAREMVADWIGAGMAIAGNPNPSQWYESNKNKIILHERTRAFVEGLIKSL